jgi:hypothetical protein
LPPGSPRGVPPRLALALGAGFAAAYLALGIHLHVHAPRLFARLDLAFDADVPSRIIDLTRAGGAHYRTQLHPLFVLLLNPIGLAVRALLRGLGTESSGRLAAIVLCALAGGTGVALFARLVGAWSASRAAAVAWSLVFGLSASQLVFASLPETFVFSGTTLLAVAVVVGDPRTRPPSRLLVAIASFGMAVSNLGAVGLARLEAAWSEGAGRALRSAVLLAITTIAATVPLAALQLFLYPRTVPFYAVGGVARDDHLSFYRPASAGDLAARLVDVGAHLAFFNLAAPRLLVHGAGTEWPTVDFPAAGPGAFRAAGAAHALAWAAVLAVALPGILRAGTSLPSPARALLSWLALHVLLHSVFGLSLFLYSCQWTFAVVALAALGFDRWVAAAPGRARAILAVPLALAALQALANAGVVADLVATFGRQG